MAGRGKGKWIQRNEAQWRTLLSRFSDSGLSVSVFCRREAVSTASFYRWRGLIERHDGGEGLAVPTPSAGRDTQGAIGAAFKSRCPNGPARLTVPLGAG